MAYNLYDLGVKGSEVKRRLDLLKSISDDDGVAKNNDLKKVQEDVYKINNDISRNSGNINQMQQQIEDMQVNKADKMTQTGITSDSSTYIQTNSGKIDFELYTYKYGRLASGEVKVENKNIFKEENYTYHFNYDDTDTNLTKYKPGQTYEKNGLTINVNNQGVISINGMADNYVYFNIASNIKFPFVNTYYTISGMDEYVGGINV